MLTLERQYSSHVGAAGVSSVARATLEVDDVSSPGGVTTSGGALAWGWPSTIVQPAMQVS